jgi:hypothetical protein
VTADAYVPLYYAPGEAYQFDWSHEIVLLEHVRPNGIQVSLGLHDVIPSE